MTTFEGIWVPLVTPFRDGALDLAAAGRLVEHLLADGVDGLVVGGTTGEPATLTDAEQARLLAAVIEATAGRCPVILGVSDNDTARVADTLERTQRSGIAGYLLTAPYFTRPSQQGIRRHFELAADATELPIVVYNIPYRAGVNIEVPTLRALAQHPRIVAIKESGNGNLDQLGALIADELRLPMTPASQECRQRLEPLLAEILALD